MSSGLVKSFDMNPHKISQIYEGSDHLIILSNNRVLLKFNKASSALEPVHTHLQEISSLHYNEGGNSFIGFASGLIQIVDSEFKAIRNLDAHQEEVTKIIHDQNTNSLYTFSEDCTVLKWDLNTYEKEQLYRHEGPALSAVFNSKLKLIISTCSESIRYIYSLSEKRIIDQSQQDSKSWSLEISEKNSLLFQGFHDGNLVISKLESPFQVLKTIQAHDSRIKYISKSENRNLLFTISFDQRVKIISLKSFEIIGNFENHNDWVRWALVTKDDLSLYTGGDDGVLCCLDIKGFNEAADDLKCPMTKLADPLIIGGVLGSACLNYNKTYEFILKANKGASNFILLPSAFVIWFFIKRINDLRKDKCRSETILNKFAKALGGFLIAPAIYSVYRTFKRLN